MQSNRFRCVNIEAVCQSGEPPFTLMLEAKQGWVPSGVYCIAPVTVVSRSVAGAGEN